MKKRLLLILLIFMVSMSFVDSKLFVDFNIKKVNYDSDKNYLEIFIQNNEKEEFNLEITIEGNEIQKIYPKDIIKQYSTKSIKIRLKETLIPEKITVKPIINGKPTENTQSYKFTGKESQTQSITQQPTTQVENILGPQQQSYQERPQQVSYSPISKKEDNKNIEYYHKDHLSSLD